MRLLRNTRSIFLLAALTATTMVWMGCGSDDNNSIGGPGGGGAALIAGSYDTVFKTWTCGTTDTSVTSLQSVFCTNTPCTEVLEIPCNVIESGNTISIDFTADVTIRGGGPTGNHKFDAGGFLSADHGISLQITMPAKTTHS